MWNPYGDSDSDSDSGAAALPVPSAKVAVVDLHADCHSDCDSDFEHLSHAETAGVVGDSLGALANSEEAQDAAARFIADKLRLFRYIEPAVRLGLRSLPSVGPSSPYKDMALDIFDEWTRLEKVNSNSKNPNLLHFTYMSLVMAQSLVLVLQQLVQKEGGGGSLSSRALSSVANQMQQRLLA